MVVSIVIVVLIQILFYSKKKKKEEKKNSKPMTIIVIQYNLFMLMRRMKIEFFKHDKYRTAGESL